MKARRIFRTAEERQRAEEMLVENEHLVERSAERARRRFLGIVPIEDLRQDARLGLLDAAQGYKPVRGDSFATFSRYRIRGAIIDGLRVSGLFSRGHQTWLRYYDPEKIAERENHTAALPAGQLELRDLIRYGLERLSPKKRRVIESIYLDGRSQRQTGVFLGRTESRISQLHKDALADLRKILAREVEPA